MPTQYRVIEVGTTGVLAEPLDGAGTERFKVVSPWRYIENEILTIETASPSAQAGSRAQVVSTRLDPSFIAAGHLGITHFADADYDLGRAASYDDEEEFDDALEDFRAGDHRTAASRIRAFLRRFPLHIDCYHHLGIIEEEEHSRVDRARKYYEMGYRIGLASLPEGFTGHLPWGRLANRPFLRAAHGFGLALLRQNRLLEACEIFESLLKLNPLDNQGVRYLLPDLYLKAKAPAKAKSFLERTGADGMNLYTLSLLEVLDGRGREALRWLCRAVNYNPYVPYKVIGQEAAGGLAGAAKEHYVTVGGPSEAVEYLARIGGYWKKGAALRFLRSVLAPGPFRARLDRVLEICEALESLPVGPERSEVVTEQLLIFSDASIPRIVSECRELLDRGVWG